MKITNTSSSKILPQDGNQILLKIDEYMQENERLAEIYRIKNKEIKIQKAVLRDHLKQKRQDLAVSTFQSLMEETIK